MQQIISKIKTIFKSSCILSCFVGHPVLEWNDRKKDRKTGEVEIKQALTWAVDGR